MILITFYLLVQELLFRWHLELQDTPLWKHWQSLVLHFLVHLQDTSGSDAFDNFKACKSSTKESASTLAGEWPNPTSADFSLSPEEEDEAAAGEADFSFRTALRISSILNGLVGLTACLKIQAENWQSDNMSSPQITHWMMVVHVNDINPKVVESLHIHCLYICMVVCTAELKWTNYFSTFNVWLFTCCSQTTELTGSRSGYWWVV